MISTTPISFVPFFHEHGPAVLDLVPSQKSFVVVDWLGYEQRSKAAFTAMRDRQPIACFGVVEAWPGRGIAWCLFGTPVKGASMVPIHRRIRDGLWDCHTRFDMRRIEMGVHTDYVDGHRWAAMLGFRREGTMRLYSADGSDMDLYARIMET